MLCVITISRFSTAAKSSTRPRYDKLHGFFSLVNFKREGKKKKKTEADEVMAVYNDTTETLVSWAVHNNK